MIAWWWIVAAIGGGIMIGIGFAVGYYIWTILHWYMTRR